MTTPKTVLSLSGGGVKGIAQLVVLAEIERITGKYIVELFDVIVGTSVGGLLAVLFGIPKPGSTKPLLSAQEALKLFEDSVADIFPQHWYHQGKIGQIFSHKYSQKPLKALLDKYLGDMKFDDLLGHVLVTAFELNKESSIKMFDSHKHKVKAKDVVRATTAAPSYLKSVKIEDEEGEHILIDGGVGPCNRPGAEAIKYFKEGLNREQQGEMLDNMTLVALNFQSPLEKQDVLPPHLDGLIPQLANGLVNNMMKASQDAGTKEVERDLPEKQFFNLLLPVPKGSTKLDNSSPKNMAKLKAASTKYIEDNKEFIENLCKDLVKNAKAMEESLKATDIDESNVSSALVASDNTNEEQDNNASSTVSNRVISKECDKQQLLIKDLNDSQYETLQKSLSTLTPRESQLLEMFLQVLDNTQIEALSGRISSIINGNHMDEIPELTNSQNMLLNSFSKMFIPDNDYNTCGQEALAQDVPCDGRGSDFSHAPPEVY
ncbi:patatin-like phospholipase family protein [Candidatus Tisiphia endosymbiont of Piscicola geometra]|uniref:patatin-like phospholipase family protein n=1 Tax=Candidatus Tisiphia endosymbiont of Piscicola geometra TaxID=3066273 RepID=UPI00312C9127